MSDLTLKALPRAVGAEEALQIVPGVKVDNQADGERVHMSIRGQGLLTERGIRGITVLLDGIPLNDPSGFVPDLFDVDWANVGRIEVFRGVASALYGGASAGGIVNIATRDGGGGKAAVDASLTGGSYSFWKGCGLRRRRRRGTSTTACRRRPIAGTAIGSTRRSTRSTSTARSAGRRRRRRN